jgi:hypothetical protein
VNYFCAIHSYLSGNRTGCIKFLAAAGKIEGIQTKYILLFLKSLFGYRLISKLKP